MARGGNKTINQRIALVGGDQVRRELLALGDTGEKAFTDITKATTQANKSTTGVNRTLLEFRKGLTNVQSSLAGVSRGIGNLTRTVGLFGGAIAAAFSVRALVDMTSRFTDLNSRIKLVIKDGEDVGKVMARLGDIADRTFTSLDQTATAFADNAVILRDLGLSTERQLDLTEALNNALVVSGARGERAAIVQNALTKALALGALRGDNLNTVLQQGGRVAQLLAEHFNVAQGELLKLGAQGEITADVLQNVLLGNMRTLREEAEAMPATIADGFLRIQNALFEFIGTADQASGVSAAIAQGLIFIADNIDVVVPAVLLFVAALGAIKAVGIIQELLSIGSAMISLLVPLAKLGIAFLAHPMTLWALAIVAAAAAILAITGNLDDFIKAVGDATGALFGFGEDTQKQTDKAVAGAGDASTAIEAIGPAADNGLGNLVKLIGDAVKGFGDLSNAADSAARSIVGLPQRGGGAPAPQANAAGGLISGAGTGTSDSILSWLSSGEYVVRARAVGKYGRGMLDAINSMRLPRFASGGLVDALGAMPAPISSGRVPNVGSSGGGRPFNLTIGSETFEGLLAPEMVADRMVRFATGAQVRKAGKNPRWYSG